MNKKMKFSNKFIILQHGSNYGTNKFHHNTVVKVNILTIFYNGEKLKNIKKIIDGYVFNVIGGNFLICQKKKLIIGYFLYQLLRVQEKICLMIPSNI